MLCHSPLWSSTSQMDLQSLYRTSTAGALPPQLLFSSHLATNCAVIAVLSVLQALDCLDEQRAWHRLATWHVLALYCKQLQELKELFSVTLCALKTLLCPCSGISTNFTRPTFPAGEIQPTDITHLQVGLTLHTKVIGLTGILS